MSCSVTIGSCEGTSYEANLELGLIKRSFWMGTCSVAIEQLQVDLAAAGEMK